VYLLFNKLSFILDPLPINHVSSKVQFCRATLIRSSLLVLRMTMCFQLPLYYYSLLVDIIIKLTNPKNSIKCIITSSTIQQHSDHVVNPQAQIVQITTSNGLGNNPSTRTNSSSVYSAEGPSTSSSYNYSKSSQCHLATLFSTSFHISPIQLVESKSCHHNIKSL